MNKYYKNNYFKIITFLFVMLGINNLAAQNNAKPLIKTAVLKGTYNVKSNKISLRWYIDDCSKLEYLLTTGVVIDRLILNANDKTAKNWVRITPNPIKAYSREILENGMKNKDTGMAVIHKCLYQKTDFPAKNMLENIQNHDMDAQNRYYILSLFVAMKNSTALAAGLGYDDEIQTDTTKSYVYRISIANGDKSIASAFVFIYSKTINEKVDFNTLRAIGKESSISLQWNAENMNFNGYWIERSTDAKTFVRVNKTIYVAHIDTSNYTQLYADSVGNYKKYYYRLAALNSFGEYTYSNITESVNARDLTAPNQPFLKAEINTNKNTINLKWTKPADSDLKGYYLLKGKTIEAGDSLLVKDFISANTTEYKFTKPSNFKRAYYRVLAVDTAGNYSLSNSSYVFVSDQIPPMAPWGLEGTIDTNGVVNLNWSVDTTDEIIGYKVFFANQEDHVFTAISNIMETYKYIDTAQLKTLTEYIFYKIVAVDQNYNHSKFSKVLKLKRPDKIAPPEPVVLDYSVNNNAIKFNWTPVGVSDLLYYKVMRRKAGEKKWNVLTTTIETSFTDSTLDENTEWEYTLTAIDNSQLSSTFAFPIAVKNGKKLKKDKIELKKVDLNDIKQSKILRWQQSNYPLHRVLIYKEIDGNLTNITSVLGSINEYQINANDKNSSFAIKFLYKDGSESEIFIEQ